MESSHAESFGFIDFIGPGFGTSVSWDFCLYSNIMECGARIIEEMQYLFAEIVSCYSG